MADEIFVGSVSVGVVPDLRGFNDRMRRELIPSADQIGKEMGQRMGQAIAANLNIGRAVSDAARRTGSEILATADRVGRDFAKRMTSAISSGLGIGPAISDSARRGEAETARAGDRTGKVFADAAKARIDAEFRGASVKVNVNLDTTAARAEIARLSGTVTERVRTTGGGTSGGGSGGGGFGITAGEAIGFGSLALIASGGLGIIPALVAASAGVAGFGALAIPTLSKVRASMTQLNTDQNAYDRALTKTARNTALAHIKQDLASMSPGQRTAVLGVQSLEKEFNKLVQTIAPLTFAVFGNGLKLVNSLLPTLLKFAVPAGEAIGILLGHMIAFSKTQGFKNFVDTMSAMSGPAIITIGDAIGHLAVAIGKLLLALISPGSMAVFTGVVDGLAAAITGLGNAYAWLTGHVNPSILHDVGIAIVAIYAGVKLWAIAQVALNAILAIFNVEMDTNPIGLVILGIAALTFAIIELVKHWRGFVTGMVDTWNWLWTNIVVRTLHGHQWLQHEIDKLLHGVAQQFDLFRHDVAHIWDDMWQATIGAAIRNQRHLETLISDWLHNIAHWFDLARHWVASAWDTMWDNTIGRAVHGWQDIYNKVWTPMRNFFTKTLPGWFDTAVKSVGNLWDNIRGAISAPVSWVGRNILAHLFNAIDDITKFVGLKTPLQAASNVLASLPAKAKGGIIAQGTTSTADDVLIRASRGETMVSAEHSRLPYMRAAFAAAGVPGYAVGGLVNPVGPGAIPERVDMGVDYGGLFDLFAIGSGRITSIANSGWPGGTFIDLQLNPPYGSGYWYYAENIQPTVNVGQTVTAGQRVGIARGYGPGTEIGWASGRGGQTAAAAAGQQNQHGDPGAYATAWGVAASNLIKSLGGPPGIISGQIHGGTAGLGGAIRTVHQILGGIGRFASSAIDLFSGGVSKAVSDMLGKIGHGAGGAGGLFKNLLLDLPGNLAHKALAFLVNKVKSFVHGQQQAGGGVPGVPPASGSALAAQNFARAHLAQFGWGLGQFPPLLALWQGESGWNDNAVNPGSGAYGIPQALGHGHPFNLGDYANQIMWGLNYIKGSYGSPARAYSEWLSRSPHWYDEGGWWPHGTLGLNMSGGTELVLSQEQLRQYAVDQKALQHSALSGGPTYNAHFDSLTGAAIESHVRTAYQAMALQHGAAQRNGRRS